MAYLHTERKNQLITLAAQFLATAPMPNGGYLEEQVINAVEAAKLLVNTVDKVIK